jgi:uncharacterized repeat protein (TIGR01451 family)
MKLFRFKQFSKKAKLLSIGVLVALTVLAVIPAMTKAGYGPGRETKVYTDGVAGFDHVTFNSFTNVPGIGDERQFFNGRYSDVGSVYSDPMPEVKDGDVLTLNVYVHNNADASLNDVADNPGVARNTKVRVALPTGIAKTQQATAYVSADNATPGTVYDTMDFGAANGGSFALEYVAGSAHVNGNYIDTALSDSVVTTGALVGTNALDGKVKGCFKEMVYVTIKVKVKMPRYSIAKVVRMDGQTKADWAETKATKAGDTTEWKITVSNTGSTPLTSIDVYDKIPAGLTLVPGSIRLFDGNYPSGLTLPASAVQENGTAINIDIGTYNPGTNAQILFKTTVNKPAANVCTVQTITNKAFTTPEGFGSIWDDANVTVAGNDCTTPTPVYSCDDLVLTPNYDNRTVSALVKYTAKDGATYKNTTLVWGDSKQDVITGTTANHQYTADGTYTVKANVLFTVNGVDKTPAVNPACSETVTFSTTTKTPSVNIVKTVEKSEVEVDQNYNYTLKVTNNGQVDLTNVKVYDTPVTGSNIQLVSANGVGTITSNTWNYTIPSLKAGESKTFTLTAKVTAYMAGNLVNNACVNAPEVNPSEPNKDDDCSDVPVTVKKPVVSVPVYSCDAVTLTSGANRKVTAKVEYTAKDGARLKVVTYNWGDNATFASDKTSADHTYASDGTYSVNVRLLFDVNGTDKYAADNTNCVKSVTFTTPTTPPTTPETPQVLPDTGAGSVVGLFGLVSVLSAIGYRLFMSRKLARER